MKKTILGLIDKKANRLHRLNEYRRVNSLISGDVGEFEIELSDEAINKLRECGKIHFNLEADFNISNGDKSGKSKYWVRVNEACLDKKTDLTYCVNGFIRSGQHSGMENWGATVELTHIDVSTNWGQLNCLVEMVAIKIDELFGKDYGFKNKWRNELLDMDFIENK